MRLDLWEGYDFEPVSAAGLSEWRRPLRFSWLDELGALPIADTELLNLSHHCPIVIHVRDGTPTVLCLLRRDLVQAPRLAQDGRWLLAYQPIALRTLPFRVRNAAGERLIEVSRDLADSPEGADPMPLFDRAGNETRDYALLLSLLDGLHSGVGRLADAARMLMAADVLVPLEGDFDGYELLTVQSELLLQAPLSRAAALTTDGFLGFDLAAATLFSQRWLASGLIGRRRAPARFETVPVHRDSGLDHGLRDAMETPLILDDSALFSFEAFAALGGDDGRA